MKSILAPDRPRQAVILAGGRGTRMRPFTDSRPKPMVEVCGKPFLHYQLEQLRAQGFERVLLLLGYLPEAIRQYCGDGRRWDLRIDYSVTAVDDETGRRVKAAEPLLEDCFLLLYCDNYWPMPWPVMWERFLRAGADAMITVYSNKDGYTKNGVRVEDDGRVSIYDKSRADPTLNGVEISYAIITRKALAPLDGENRPFESAVYPPLAARGRLAGFVSDHRYYSIGAPHRLPLTESFFRREKTVLVDRDGVLNRKPPRAAYVSSWRDFEWLPGAKSALRLLRQAGYRVIVVSNQAGLARGAMSEAALDEIHARMTEEIRTAGGEIAAIYYCPHDWDSGCECRKPRPGMLFQAQREFHLDLSRTPFIGDDERDGEAAAAAGCPFARVSDGKSFFQCVQEIINHPGEEPQTLCSQSF